MGASAQGGLAAMPGQQGAHLPRRHPFFPHLLLGDDSIFYLLIFKFFFFSLDVDHFLSVYCICYNITSVLCFGFLTTRHVGSWLPKQGLNPHPLH